MKEHDFTVWLNLTAPYSSGKGRRTVWRGRSRVSAVSTEAAITSQNFESIGKTVVHSPYKAICILGAGWEMHILCPGDEPHCKVCGALKSAPSGFCRDCCPAPDKSITGDSLELAPRYEKLAVNRLKPIAQNTAQKRRRPGRKAKKKIVVDLDAAQRMLLDEF